MRTRRVRGFFAGDRRSRARGRRRFDAEKSNLHLVFAQVQTFGSHHIMCILDLYI